MVATVLFVTPLMPSFPEAGLDPSWRYALNEAVARHLVFGRDFIFTFGPLASVYTTMYHPATDWMMLFGSVMMGAGLSIGCALLAYPKKLLNVLILPLLIAEIVWRDSIFIFLPFLLLVLVSRVCCEADSVYHLEPSKQVCLAIAIVACSVALLPLIKGSFTAAAFFSCGLSFLALLHRPAAALGFACLMVAVVCAAWVGTGQPLEALPAYFIAQGPMISHYSEAMSINGAPEEVVVYLLISLFLLGVFYTQISRRLGRYGLASLAALAFTLFVVFKAAFVRHDGHAVIAAGALLLGGYCISAMTRSAVSLMVWIVVVIGWFYIDHNYTGLNILKASQRVADSLTRTYDGAKARISASDKLKATFDQRNESIRAKLPLAPVEGTVDAYPFELSTIFAHSLPWKPRPIFQSYAAYDSQLDALNASHLMGTDAPMYVYFQVRPIDERLASLEDAGSWPLLLSRYSVVDRDGNFLVLARSPTMTSAPEMKSDSKNHERLGRQFNLPNTGEPIWAEIDVRPTFLGRIITVLFKPSQLRILFRFEDGHTESFRYVPAMGRRGFVISPIIHSNRDFAALLTKGRAQYFFDARPTSVEIAGDAETRLFWRDRFAVDLFRIELPVQYDAEKFVYDQWLSDVVINRETVGTAECYIDAIDRKPLTGDPIDATGPLLVQGWAVISGERGIAGNQVFVTVSGEEGGFRVARARSILRPDVNAYFKHPEMGAVGFEAFLDTTDLNGTYKLQIYVERQSQMFSCPVTVEIRK